MRGDELLLGLPQQPTDDQTLGNANANRSTSTAAATKSPSMNFS
jgi:hypothetical protein